MPPPPNWVALSNFRNQFDDNVLSLEKRDRELAGRLKALAPEAEYFISSQPELIALGRRGADGNVVALANPVTPGTARVVAGKMFPTGRYAQPTMVVGLDQGWLWEALYKLDATVASAPGMRLPLYLLAGDLERLWAVLHFQNWTALLADPRVSIQVGADAVARVQVALEGNSRLLAPRLSVTVEPSLWSTGRNYDDFIRAVSASFAARLGAARQELTKLERPDRAALAEKFRTGRLRVLGITSRFTTFLQYSMRDWLAALGALGHETRLLMEQADHESMTPLVFAEECRSFKPDLILMIDHCRGEYDGLPAQVPFVMWVQDRLPNIYRPEAGAMQKASDYVIGYGLLECALEWGYPAERMMPTNVGVNESRFVARELSEDELAKYRCDVSFVSHASATAEQIVEEEAARSGSPQTRGILEDLLGRLRDIYDAGNSITEPIPLRALIDSVLCERRMTCANQSLLDVVMHRLNNALLRHQAIGWLVDMGVDLRLYGKGWERHPRFGRFARGVADNEKQLATIYQASTINLHANPFGSAHQRVFEGLAVGGFFLLRGVTGDAAERINVQVWDWCQRKGVRSAEEMLAKTDDTFFALVGAMKSATGFDARAEARLFYAGIREGAQGDFTRGASTLWDEFDEVAFWSKEQLTRQVTHFLANAGDRRRIAGAMRQRVMETSTYTAISRRMLGFIADDLALQVAGAGPTPIAVAA